MAELPDPASVAARSERSAFAESTPSAAVCATCRGLVSVRARYDDYWQTPLTLQGLRVTDMNGIVFDGDLRTQGLLNFGASDGSVSEDELAALREYLGSIEAADAQRGPLLVETVPDPGIDEQIAELEREILSDLRAFASRMETVIQPWIDEWQRSGWFGALGTFLEGLKNGVAAWVDGEGEFWAGMWEWVSGLPDMLGEGWDNLSAGVRALWENRHRIVELLQSLAEGAVDAFERGFEALLDVLEGLPGIEEIVELLRSLVLRSAEWAGAMIETVRQTEVLRGLTATALGVLVLIPPNYWAEVAGTGIGFLIPEAIIAILFLIIAAFTGGTGGAALAARLVIFANGVARRLRAAGRAAGAIVDMLTFLGGLVDKLTELVRKVMRNRRERAAGQTDQEVPIVRSATRAAGLREVRREIAEEGAQVLTDSDPEVRRLLDHNARQMGMDPEDVHAATIGDTILVRAEHAENPRILAEELAHVRQQASGAVSSANIDILEIEAREYVISNADRFGITPGEVVEMLEEIDQIRISGY